MHSVTIADEDPELDKTGMPAFRITDIDANLKDYYGIHVGNADEWVPVLLRDGWDAEYVYIYLIDIAAWMADMDEADIEEVAKNDELESIEELETLSNRPFVMEDPHPYDRTVTPDSDIIFSRYKTIPAKYITLDRVLDVADIEPARELY